MAADVNAIVLGWEGREEADYELKVAIYGAQGIRLGPLRPPEKPDIAKQLKEFARINNARFRARQRQEAKASAKQ